MAKPSTPHPPDRINDVYSDIADALNSSSPFADRVNYMSFPGFIRYRFYLVTGHWLSRAECLQIISAGSPVDGSLREMGQNTNHLAAWDAQGKRARGVVEYKNPRELTSFSPEANYMSITGYTRWLYFVRTGNWISRAEANSWVFGGHLNPLEEIFEAEKDKI